MPSAPKTLLRLAGFEVTEPAEPHICCGSAGIYNLVQPEIAGRLRERKLDNLRAVRPDVIAAGNIGCMTQLSGAASRWRIPWSCWTGWRAAPRPQALSAS